MCPLCWITGQLDQAATWLWENAESMSGRNRANSDSSSHSTPPLSGVEVKADSVCICFIDDCMDCDVPLAELTFSRENDCMKWWSDIKHRYCNRLMCVGFLSMQVFLFSRGLDLCRKERLVLHFLEIITTENFQVRSRRVPYLVILYNKKTGNPSNLQLNYHLSLVWSYSIGRSTVPLIAELSVNQCLSVYTRLRRLVYRLGTVHRALAVFPGLAEAGGRPAPSSSPEDRTSSQAEAGCQHHLCLTGYLVWVKYTRKPPDFSLDVCFHIYERRVHFDTLLRACLSDTQSSTAPPKLRG